MARQSQVKDRGKRLAWGPIPSLWHRGEAEGPAKGWGIPSYTYLERGPGPVGPVIHADGLLGWRNPASRPPSGPYPNRNINTERGRPSKSDGGHNDWRKTIQAIFVKAPVTCQFVRADLSISYHPHSTSVRYDKPWPFSWHTMMIFKNRVFRFFQVF